MVERYKRKHRRRKLLGNHQKCWIWGRNAVMETLDAGRWEMVELRLSDELPEADHRTLMASAERLGVPVIVGTPADLSRSCRSDEHQGMIAKMTAFPYADVDAILEPLAESPRNSPLYVVLDGVQDPFNFGAIVRSAEVLGAGGVFIASTGQVGVTSLVARTSAGAVNHVPIARVADLAAFASRLQATGTQIVAAAATGATPVYDCDLRKATALVIGNEGRGIRPELLQLCDRVVSIPQAGHIDSLNAAVAASILFYEAARQRATPALNPQPSTLNP